MKVEAIDGTTQNIRLREYRELRANAYAIGTLGAPKPDFKYKFCVEAYEDGQKADQLLREELATKQR